MRVAALYDVHGNLPALDAVLAEVADEGVETVVCGGDVVGGPFPAEVLDRLAGLPDVHFVRGNADREVLGGTDEHGIDWEVERARLGPERLALVRSWPLTTELDVEGLGRVVFCHAVPRSSSGTRTSSSTGCCPPASASSMPAASACRTRAGTGRSGPSSGRTSSCGAPSTTSTQP